ncbi:MAG: SlyX family protein [Limisphaerales bacterium]
MSEHLDERLARIECQLSHLERANEELNSVVLDQGRALAKLQSVVRRLTETIETAELDRLHADTRKPPHSA